MHVIVTSHSTPGLYSIGDLIGFTTGLLITVLLLVLTLRAAKLPGTPQANIVFALCALLWSAGGMAHAAVIASGIPSAARWGMVAQAFQFSGVAAFPIPVLAVWRSFATASRQKAAGILQIAACLTAATIAVLLWISPVAAMHATPYNASLLLLAGAMVSLRRDSTPRPVYFPSLFMVTAVCGATIALTMARGYGGSITSIGAHLVLLVMLCAFLLFGRFRYADLFIRYGVRILLAGIWASMLAVVAQSWLVVHLAKQMFPGVLHVFLVISFANVLLLSFSFVDERLSAMIMRWLFHSPDYRAEIRKLGARLSLLQFEPEIAAAVEEAALRPLELSAAQLVPVGEEPSRWPAGVLEGETVELDFKDQVLAPVSTAGRVTHVLSVSPGATRPGLVTRDLNYLAAIAAQCGNRLDALAREREAVERQSRESLLLQQVTEAELRALRAQINPHFLFNSLNTIADLIVRDPAGAEVMTLRLASVFRHVLAHSARPLTTIRDEIEFLRTYLYIEEARFGDRLQVEIDMAPEVAGDQIPSLILQPLVENALKHGLGPKPGPGHLWIFAHAQGDRVCLRVEDDGLGPSRQTRSAGLGLTNISERLNTLYHDGASVKLEAREGGGSRATVLIPR